jgi:hypothetical protein
MRKGPRKPPWAKKNVSPGTVTYTKSTTIGVKLGKMTVLTISRGSFIVPAASEDQASATLAALVPEQSVQRPARLRKSALRSAAALAVAAGRF